MRHGKLPSCEKPLLTDLLSVGLAFVGSTVNALCRIMAAFFLQLALEVKRHPAKRRLATFHFDTSGRSSLEYYASGRRHSLKAPGNVPHEQEHQHDYQQQAQHTAGTVPPASAVAPSWQTTHEQHDQNDE